MALHKRSVVTLEGSKVWTNAAETGRSRGMTRTISASTSSVFAGRSRMMDYQIILILKGVVQGGDPLAISIYQHVTFLPKTRRLQKESNRVKMQI